MYGAEEGYTIQLFGINNGSTWPQHNKVKRKENVWLYDMVSYSAISLSPIAQ